MAYRVLVSEPTHADVDSAIGHIALTLGVPSAAASLLDEYEHALGLLADNPLLFGVDLRVGEAPDMQIRRCPVKRYGIHYPVKALSPTGNPSSSTVRKAVTALGYRLDVALPASA